MLENIKNRLTSYVPEEKKQKVKPSNPFFDKNTIKACLEKFNFSNRYKKVFFSQSPVIEKPFSCPELKQIFDKNEIHTLKDIEDADKGFVIFDEKQDKYISKYEALDIFAKNAECKDIDDLINKEYVFERTKRYGIQEHEGGYEEESKCEITYTEGDIDADIEVEDAYGNTWYVYE